MKSKAALAECRWHEWLLLYHLSQGTIVHTPHWEDTCAASRRRGITILPLVHHDHAEVPTVGLLKRGGEPIMVCIFQVCHAQDEGSHTFAQRLLKSTVDRYLSPKDGKTTTTSLPLFSGLWATLRSKQHT